MMLLRALLAAALAFLPLAEASAGSGTITTKDASGTTRTFVVTTDGSGNFVGQTVLCDGTAAASCATVSGGALSVNVASATGLAQGSTTSGQTGSLVMGAVTTAAPSYTTAQTSPISLDTAGNTRVALAAETTKVIGTVRNLGNAGAVFDAATGAAPPANVVALGARGISGTTGGLMQIPITCDSHVFKHITSATDTVAVQGVASQTIYICNWRSRAAGTATWYLENTASTNNNCSSTLTQITGVATETANSGEVYAPGYWQGLKNTSGNGLCINSTGTGGVDVDIWYAQF